MLKRRRFKQTTTLTERLADEAARCRAEARMLAPGRRREMLLRRARQDETAMQIDAWLHSPGLRAPT
ncbi:ClpP class serine protease [Bradyrhizobium sp. USDA 4354]